MKRLAILAAALGAWLAATVPAPQEDGAVRWDAVHRRLQNSELRRAGTFPAYCAQRLMAEERLEPGHSVLALAMGDGRHAVNFAVKGLRVTGVDISPVGLEKARKLAESEGAEIETVEADLFAYDFGNEKWDLVTNIYFNPLIRSFKKLKDAVKPGGYLLVEGFGSEHEGGPPAWSHYKPNQLIEELAGWRILEYQDGLFESEWAQGKSAPVVRLLAQKPSGGE